MEYHDNIQFEVQIYLVLGPIYKKKNYYRHYMASYLHNITHNFMQFKI